MISLIVISFLTLAALAVLYVVFSARRATLLARERQQLEEEKESLLAREKASMEEFVDALGPGGRSVEQALPAYQTSRGQLPPARSCRLQPWNWDAEDRERWERSDWERRCEAINRKVFTPALVSGLLVLALGVVTVGVTWQFQGPQSIDKGNGFSGGNLADPPASAIPAGQPGFDPAANPPPVPPAPVVPPNPTLPPPNPAPPPPNPPADPDMGGPDANPPPLTMALNARPSFAFDQGEHMNRLLLPMLGANHQRQLHGGIMASQTELSSKGTNQAKQTLFDKVAEKYAQPTDGNRLIRLVDQLKPGNQVKHVLERVTAKEGLIPPLPQREAIKDRLQRLIELNAQEHNPVTHDALKAVAEHGDQLLDHLRAEAVRDFHQSPGLTGEQFVMLRSSLDAIELPTPNSQPLARLRKVVQDLDNIDLIRSSLPRMRQNDIDNLLLMKARHLVHEALHEQIQQMITHLFKQKRDELRPFFKELESRSGAHRAKMDTVREVLKAQQLQAEQQSLGGRSSATYVLAGPDENEVLTGMRERFDCTDLGALVERLRERFEGKLRTYARKHCPALDSEHVAIAELFLALKPDPIADLWSQTVEENLGKGQSLYERIHRHGVATFAQELYDKTEHTINLGARNTDELNVNTTMVTVISLPPAQKPEDVEIRAALAQEFLRLNEPDQSSLIKDLPEGHPQVITVMHVELGWPMAIDQSNYTLLQAYAEAAERDHLPHLVSLSECGAATALPRYRELAQVLENEEESAPRPPSA